MSKRIFDSVEELEWLQMHKPAGTTVRLTTQGDAFVIEGPNDKATKRRIDEYVEKFATTPA